MPKFILSTNPQQDAQNNARFYIKEGEHYCPVLSSAHKAEGDLYIIVSNIYYKDHNGEVVQADIPLVGYVKELYIKQE